MEIDPAVCERARQARDPRFDGRFFIGVVTTGIYCRPVCPVKPPKPENVRFFPTAAGCEEAGFRPCRRCRPETSPGTPAWLGRSATVSRALRLMESGGLDPGSVTGLAARLGIGDRHLRRLFGEVLGASPRAVARTRRAHFARRLIDQTDLPMSQVALSAGFRSVRQFNQAVRSTFADTPSALRLRARRGSEAAPGQAVVLRLPYRPPFCFDAVLRFLAPRVMPGVEEVGPASYRRVVRQGAGAALLEVSAAADRPELELRIEGGFPGDLIDLVEGVRRLFDLAADPLRIADDLARDPLLRPRVRRRPGLRLPGAFDPFELAVRAVLGQQVSVRGATTLAGRLVRGFGKPVSMPDARGLSHVFPDPERLADVDVAAIGLPKARAQAIRSLACAVAEGRLRLDGAMELEESVAALCQLPGIGDWTASYIAMRALGEPDAFPAGDLGLRKALAVGGVLPSRAAVCARAEAWRPWRAYAAIWLWTDLASAPRRRASEESP